MIRLLVFFASTFTFLSAVSQTGVSINNNGAAPAVSAQLDVSSSNKGVLFPRMSSAQRKALPNPAAGLMVYDLDRATIYLFDGTMWRPLSFTSDQRLPLIERLPTITGDNFVELGCAVDIYGIYAVAGAYKEAVELNANQGVAYIYRKDGSWQLHQKVTSPDGGNADAFGSSVAMYNDVLVVGAPDANVNGISKAGAVYIFKRSGDTWAFSKKIIPPQAEVGGEFGADVSVYNDKIVIASPAKTINSVSGAGTVYLYESAGNEWAVTKEFKPATPEQSGRFGKSVKISGNDVVIGYPAGSTQNLKAGTVHVYTRNPINNSWTEASFGFISPKAGMSFGTAVDIYQDTIIAGAPYYTMPGGDENSGAVEIYIRQNGVWEPSIFWYGTGVQHREGGAVAVGLGGNLSGAIYYPKGGRVYGGRFTGLRIDYRDIENVEATRFGAAIAISGNDFIIGAPGKNSSKGSVHFGSF